MTSPLRNLRHETFVRHYMKTHNAAEAYRRVYPRHRPDIARITAHQLLTRPDVQRRLKEARAAVIRRADITVDRILQEFEEARQLARKRQRPMDMLAASEKKARLAGLLSRRSDLGDAGELTDTTAVLATLAQEAGTQVAGAVAQALGIDWE